MKNITNMKKAELIEEIEKKQEEIAELKKAQEKLAKYEAYEKMGDELMAVKQGFINSGFSEEEAFRLMIELMKIAAAQNIAGNAEIKPPVRSGQYPWHIERVLRGLN